MAYRKFNSHIKSIVHFDFPYFHEPDDGLSDDLGLLTLARAGGAKLVGSESPADAIVSNTPRFGYRCLQTDGNNSYVQGTGTFTLAPSGNYEFSLWVRPTASTAGNFLQLLNGSTVLFSASLNSSLQVACSASTLALNLTSSQTIPLNTWTLLRFQFAQGKFTLKIGTAESYAEGLNSTSLNVTSLRIGGITGQIDEFIFRDNFTDSIPTQPMQARLNISELGGYGTGSLGNVAISSNCVLSSCAYFSAKVSGGSFNKFTLSGLTAGKFGTFKAGDEVMILNPQDGSYEFRTITDFTNNTVTLSSAPSVVISYGSTMLVQVPHFNSLTVNSGSVITPPQRTSSTAGGITAFRVKGNCTINGSVITHGYGMPRTDTIQMTHSKLIDNFLCGSGGGIFIACGGTFTAGSSARLGATWNGSSKGGAPVSRGKGGDGGAGYGGAGGSDVDSNALGGYGGVGGGGGGSDQNSSGSLTGYNAGQSHGTGGDFNFHGENVTSRFGGSQGVNIGGAGVQDGGGGAGGNGTNDSGGSKGAGANIILLAKTLRVDEAALSTGGQGGASENSGHQSGGGGTGFCYIACEVMN